MTEQKEKKQTSRLTGYFLIFIGVFGISQNFHTNSVWNIPTIIKFSISVLAVGYGLWAVFSRKK